jgi:ABC-2 type transport system ATP-binding protein
VSGLAISTDRLRMTFGDSNALADLTLDLPAGRITGLLGRNGAGKSTLMALLAGYRRASDGSIRIDGDDPYENGRLMAETCLVRDAVPFADSTTVRGHFQVVAAVRPRWDQEYADRLIDLFELPARKRIGKLSHGKQAAVSVITALASRAPVTMFDEPHLGMDAPSRYAFYDELLADYAARPRTIILSTHIIDEIANLIEDVVILDAGRLVVHDSVDRLRSRGAVVSGKAADVDDVTFGLRVLSSRTFGSIKQAVVYDEFNGEFARRAASLGVDLEPIPLQDLFIHLTSREHAAA